MNSETRQLLLDTMYSSTRNSKRTEFISERVHENGVLTWNTRERGTTKDGNGEMYLHTVAYAIADDSNVVHGVVTKPHVDSFEIDLEAYAKFLPTN